MIFSGDLRLPYLAAKMWMISSWKQKQFKHLIENISFNNNNMIHINNMIINY